MRWLICLPLLARCSSPSDPVPVCLRGFLAEGEVDGAVEFCFDVLDADPRNPSARAMLWPLMELVDDQTRRSVIRHHGSGVHAFEQYYNDRLLIPRFLRGCRMAWEGDAVGAKREFLEILRDSEAGPSRHWKVLVREAALRFAELP